MGVYPRTPIDRDADLKAGLQQLREEGLVSLAVVPDPLAAPDPARLLKAFAVCRHFKTHLLMDRSRGFSPSKHHGEEIRRGLRRCSVGQVALEPNLGTWRELYDVLITKHSIEGTANFPNRYFEQLARLPSVTAFQACIGDAVAGMSLWISHDGIAVSHLAATNALGYANSASYALYATAFEHFAGIDVFDLGGGAGHEDDPSDGLFRFKQGFANAEVSALLCGAVLDEERYRELAGNRVTDFFPAYRA
jgi:hypothetical protein